MDSIEGALLGGLGIGLVQAFTSSFLGSQFLDITTYAVLLLVLLLRPQGLLGTRAAVRV
jgi:branched-subunit amino acid ABC-type transport system permease component